MHRGHLSEEPALAAEAEQAAAGGSTGSTGETDEDVVDAEIVDEPTDAADEGDSK